MTSPSLYTRFEGGWCDNCRTAYSFIPRDGNCPSCGPVKLRPATITVEPDDAEKPPQPTRHPALDMPQPKGYMCPACGHGTAVHREAGCDVRDCDCPAPYGRIMPGDQGG